MRRPIEERFWAKVDKSAGADGCWPWAKGRASKGYGYTYAYGKHWRAHRLAWVLTYGAIPAGMHVCHSCDTPVCCNPGHLWVGDAADNMQDKVRKGRSHSVSGERVGTHRLSESQVREILRLHDEARVKDAAIARRFATTRANIGLIVHRRTWRCIGGAHGNNLVECDATTTTEAACATP